MHYTRAHAEIVQAGQRSQDKWHLLVSHGPVRSGTTPVTYDRPWLHHYAPKKTGRKRQEALWRMREWEKWEILVEGKGEKKKTVGSVSCGCDTGVLINSEGAGVFPACLCPSQPLSSQSRCTTIQSEKKAANYPAKTTGPVLAWDATYSAGVWENALHALSVWFI